MKKVAMLMLIGFVLSFGTMFGQEDSTEEGFFSVKDTVIEEADFFEIEETELVIEEEKSSSSLYIIIGAVAVVVIGAVVVIKKKSK